MMTTDAEVIDTTAIVVSDQPVSAATLFGTSEPVEIVDKATAVADALKDVIRKQGLISNIQGKEYVRVEGWTLLGTMLGVFPVNVWTREVEGGWEARVEARTTAGAVVGAAEAQCTKSEPTWAKRDAYALRSMAQTRATSKALRMPLGFVVTLAGFEATPAEEMTFAGTGMPDRQGAGMAQSQANCTDKQAGFIKKLLREEVDPAELKGFVAGLESSYPYAFEGGRLVVERLTKGDAGELITLLKEPKGVPTQASMADLPQE